jgi:hypothetical protein
MRPLNVRAVTWAFPSPIANSTRLPFRTPAAGAAAIGKSLCTVPLTVSSLNWAPELPGMVRRTVPECDSKS